MNLSDSNKRLHTKIYKTNFEKYNQSLKGQYQPEVDYDLDLSEISHYNKGKYYNELKPGYVIINRYILKQKLKKNFWLSFDLKYGNYVSIKIIKINYDETIDDIEINFLKKIYKYNFSPEWLKRLNEYYKKDNYILSELNFEEHTNIIQLLNYFIYESINNEEKYFCNIYEITGITLQTLLNKFCHKNKNINKGIPLPYVRIIARQILIGLDFIHTFGEVIHTKLNMDNILIGLNKEELETIQETGFIYIEDGNEKIEENNYDEIGDKFINDLKNNTQQISRKNEERIIKRQEKQMEKMGLSPNSQNKHLNINKSDNNYNNINIDELYKQLNEQYDIDINININNRHNLNIKDIIQRPRIASVPKINIKNNKYDFNIDNYKNEIQTYLKEKDKIKCDEQYKKNIFLKNIFLEQTLPSKTRIAFLKKLNKENALNGPKIDNDIKIKLSDFNHVIKLNKKNKNIFLKSKQKEEYLSPEILFGLNYDESIDIWALGCIIFELATGDSLFKVKRDANFSLNENHILKFIEILGYIPKKLIMKMKQPKIYFDMLEKFNQFKTIKKTNIKNLLIEKYNFKINEAQALHDFLSKMFEYFPEKRPSAKNLLAHPWLNMPSNFDYFNTDENVNNINNNIINENKNEKIDENYLNNLIKEQNENEFNQEYIADDEDNSQDENNNENNNINESGENDDEDSGDENPDKIIIPNYNNSFAEYGQFIDLTSSDKKNPQFDEIINKNKNDDFL